MSIASAATLLFALLAPALARQDGQHTAVVSGTFVDAEGRPVAGVRVTSAFYPGATLTAETDADGRFRTILAWDEKERETWYRGEARKHGFAVLKWKADVRAGEERDFGELTLEPGGVLVGSVVDDAGKPLHDAFLCLIDPARHGVPTADKRSPQRWQDVSDTCKSDANGRIELVGVPSGKWYVRAWHRTTWWGTGGPIEVRAGAIAELPTLRLENLPAEHWIAGRVVGPLGEPIPGARIRTHVRNPTAPETMTTIEAKTDASGSFSLVLPFVERDSVWLSIDPNSERFEDASATVAPGSRDNLIRLRGKVELRIRVVDSNGPVESFGWDAVAKDSNTFFGSPGPSKPHDGGRATILVPSTTFDLAVGSELHETRRITGLHPDSLPELLEIRLTELPAFSGIVTYRGQPVPGAHVELVRPDRIHAGDLVEDQVSGLYRSDSRNEIRTDEVGRFRIPNRYPHFDYRIRAWADGHAEGLSGPVGGSADGIRIELTDGGAVEGTVRLPDGTPIEGIELSFFQHKPGFDSRSERVFRIRPGADGRFRQEHLTAGTWMLSVGMTGNLAARLGWSEEQVAEAALPYVLEIRELETTFQDVAPESDPICALDGRITVGGQTFGGYALLILQGAYKLDVAFAGIADDGTFRIAARKPGTYRLVMTVGPGHHQTRDVTDLVDLAFGSEPYEVDVPLEQWTAGDVRLDPR